MRESLLRRMQRSLGNRTDSLWRYSPGGAIWRVSPSHPDILVGEERDLSTKQTRFFCLDKISGRVRWEKRSYGEPWWIGIEAMNNDMLFLHRFLKPDMPEHKSIIAVDLATGNELWRNDDVVLDRVFAGTILACRSTIHGNDTIELDARTGIVVTAPSNRLLPERFDDDVNYPVVISDPAIALPGYANVWKHLPSGELLGPTLEIVDLGSCVVAAYYLRVSPPAESPPRYRQEILAGTPAGHVIFKETIIDTTPAILPDSFFVQGGAVVFVAKRNTLTSVRLPGTEL